MNISNYLADALLNEVFRGTEYVTPATVYVALYTSDPTRADTGVEVTGGAYARQSVAFNVPADVTSKRTIENTADVVFPVATADWGLITHVGIRDALTVGNLLYYGPLNSSRSILSGDRMRCLAGELDLSLN
jgi:hypothetical protein